MIDHWLSPIRHIRRRNRAAFDSLPNERSRWDRLCELNVIEQTVSVSQLRFFGIRGLGAARLPYMAGSTIRMTGACAI
jgi:hypothetical protein